jgi:hypothetical protein
LLAMVDNYNAYALNKRGDPNRQQAGYYRVA